MILSDILPKSESKLVGLHPLVRYMAIRLVSESLLGGVPIIITQGLRTTEYQNQLFSQGRKFEKGKWFVVDKCKIVTNAKGGRSMHNYGLAVDFALLLPNGAASWDARRDGDSDGQKDFYEVGAIGRRIFGEWGGDWDRFVDMPHLQHTFGLTIDQLQKGTKPKLSAEQANGMIATQLVPAYNEAKAKGDQAGMKRAHDSANELRLASGQKTGG